MTIFIDGFEFIEFNNKPSAMWLNGENLNREIEYINSHNIKSIYLSYIKSNKIKNLTFLRDIPKVEEVNLNGMEFSYDSIYYLTSLKKLTCTIQNNTQHLDFSLFPKLEFLNVDWFNNFPNLSKNNALNNLLISQFKPKSKSLENLQLPLGLDSLKLVNSNIMNLEHIQTNNVLSLEIHYCKSLISLNGLSKIKEKLESLIIQNSKKISDFDQIGDCQNLSKIILSECEIPSLNWLKKLKKVKHFTFVNSNVIDGDISPCFGINYVAFTQKKHYSHKEKEFLHK